MEGLDVLEVFCENWELGNTTFASRCSIVCRIATFCENWKLGYTVFASRCSIVCRIATFENGRGPGCLRMLAAVDVFSGFRES